MSKFRGNSEIRKVPVHYKKTVLMPTSWRKATKLMKEGKAILVKDKVLGVYLKLKYKPKTTYTQTMVLGIDPGSMFDGYTVVSDDEDHCRNFQYNHQLPISKSLKTIMNKRLMYRKARRFRLRSRKCRNQFRTGKKITNTNNYYFQNRVNMIHRIMSLYPISTISIEDVRFNHFLSDKGKSFSNIEVGKARFYEYIIKVLKLNLIKCKGSDTKEMRETLFPDRTKNKDKSIRNFDSHCIDSYSIGVLGYIELTKDYRSFVDLPIKKLYSTAVRFIDRVKYKFRRELYNLRSVQGSKKFYFKYRKGGEKCIFTHYSKLKKIRSKSSDTNSNHGRIWEYSYTDVVPTLKSVLSRFGGTTIKEGSKCKFLGRPSKYWDGSNYKYYNIEVV